MKKRIVIADDDETILESLKIVLDKAGYRTETMLNGKVLLNHIPGGSNLFLLNIRRSTSDGLTICRHLKSLESTREIPVILTSAVPELEGLAIEAGADDFLVKPFNINQLLHMMEKHLKMN